MHGATAVAVDATPTLETVVAVLGGLLAGAAVVPVPADAGPAEREHILRDSGAELVLGTTVDVTRRSSTTYPAPAPDDAALIMYTSGTTGAPKGVRARARVRRGRGRRGRRGLGLDPRRRLVHGLPLFHVHGLVLGVLGALRAGSPLVHTGKPQPEALCGRRRHPLLRGADRVVTGVRAARGGAGALCRARLLVSGSAALPVPVFERLHALTGHGPWSATG